VSYQLGFIITNNKNLKIMTEKTALVIVKNIVRTMFYIALLLIGFLFGIRDKEIEYQKGVNQNFIQRIDTVYVPIK